MTEANRGFSDVVDVELNADDLQMIQFIRTRGFLTEEDLHQFLPLETNAPSMVFRVTRECLVYVGFGLKSTIEEIAENAVQESLKATLEKVWPHLEGLEQGGENCEDDYADGR